HEQEDNQPDSSLHTVLAPVPVTLLREGFSRHLERNLVFLASPSWIFHIGGVSVILPRPHTGPIRHYFINLLNFLRHQAGPKVARGSALQVRRRDRRWPNHGWRAGRVTNFCEATAADLA